LEQLLAADDLALSKYSSPLFNMLGACSARV
jgi:hypothetical protein